MSNKERLMVWFMIFFLLLANFLVFLRAESTIVSGYSVGYQEGYQAGNLDAIEGKYTRRGWEMAGMILDDAYREASRIINMEQRKFLENMIEEATQRAIDEGYGWRTGQSK